MALGLLQTFGLSYDFMAVFAGLDSAPRQFTANNQGVETEVSWTPDTGLRTKVTCWVLSLPACCSMRSARPREEEQNPAALGGWGQEETTFPSR